MQEQVYNASANTKLVTLTGLGNTQKEEKGLTRVVQVIPFVDVEFATVGVRKRLSSMVS